MGNRAAGDRIDAIVDQGRAMTGAAIVLLSPFVPMLFQGQEWGTRRPFQYFTDHADAALAEAVRRGRKAEFASAGWKPEAVPDPQDPETFRRSKLDWREPAESRCEAMLKWHRDLIDLRRSYPELTDGRLDAVQVKVDESERWLAFRRGRIAAACNFGETPRRVPLLRPPSLQRAASTATPLLSSHSGNAARPEGALVQPGGALVASWRG